MKFSNKEIMWTLIFILISAYLITGSIHSFIEYSKSGADWISALLSFLGNIIGGIAGGLVAILIAKYQIYKAKLQEEIKQVETTQTMLKLIREELRDNVSLLTSSIPFKEDDYNLLRVSLSDDTWKSTMLHLFIRDDLLVKIHVCYKKISLVKNLNLEEIEDAILTNCKNTIEQTIDNIKSDLEPK
jgi:hypothetical protein